MDYEVFLISLILLAGCNKHCKLQNVSRGEKRRKKKVEIKTQNEKIVETERDNGTKHMKKQLFEPGRNSAM